MAVLEMPAVLKQAERIYGMNRSKPGIFSRPAFWITAGLLLRFGLDVIADMIIERKRRRRKHVS